MGVLIKGLEMPKEGCKDCLLVKRGRVFDICPFLKREVNGNVERGGKPYDCPLMELPDHGRLIDGDELAAGCDAPYWCRWLSEIEDAPTIIPAERE